MRRSAETPPAKNGRRFCKKLCDDAKQPDRHAAENEQRQNVCNGRDKGIGKYGRVNMDGLGEDGHAAADDLSDDDRKSDGDGNGGRIEKSIIISEDQPVDELQLQKAYGSDRNGYEQGDAQFFPYDFKDISRAYFV